MSNLKLQDQEKVCAACGRTFSWRKKWEKDWIHVKYCSHSCGRNKAPIQYKQMILELLSKRRADQSICPSEILDEIDKKNKEKMEAVRSAARLLVREGLLEITQNNKVVDPDSFRGPIRLRLKRKV